MKFLANMTDSQYMKEFHNIIITLSKLSKECLMDIREEKLYFMANEEQTATTMSTGAAPLVWIEIDVNCYFHDYIMDGVRVAEETEGEKECNGSSNRIMLTLSPIHLSRALNALKLMARSIKMKLINLQFPCLRIEVDILQTGAVQHQSKDEGNGDGDGEQLNNRHPNNGRQIVHDVPVSVIARSDWSYYRIPQIPVTKFLIHIKSCRLMKNLIDKLKNISPSLTFEGNSEGVLCLMAKTEMAAITMRYKHLAVHMSSQQQQQQQQQQHMNEGEVDIATEVCSNMNQVTASCSVDCKKAAIFLTALQVPAAAIDCSIDDDHLIHLQVNVRTGVVVIHSMLPALCF